jgi:hypothetical protein
LRDVKLGTGALIAAMALAIVVPGAGAASRSGARNIPAIAYVAGAGVPYVWIARTDGTHARQLEVRQSTLISPNGKSIAAIP